MGGTNFRDLCGCISSWRRSRTAGFTSRAARPMFLKAPQNHSTAQFAPAKKRESQVSYPICVIPDGTLEVDARSML
ncbi:hypothetical protein RB6098 [Rhodopirellula baltica SH 1]|uniref:Uncharacterized protein n=2 Tax=Rhodopirellula baltica TaxID=265606 RepID=Q7UQU0_RHOBA|nr:hypothetical protein RB6098 [Rhodopirellula baltica SH 1]